MAEVMPFRGIHYDPSGAPLSEVIAPPYDILSPRDQETLYRRHPDNIVRLILNRAETDDRTPHDRYARAGAFLRSALASGVLVEDPDAGFYEYVQRFSSPLDPAKRCERSALLAAVRLEPYESGIVLPHEETHAAAKADRLELMRATGANPEPIYGLYEDPDGRLADRVRAARAASAPLLAGTVAWADSAGPEEHELYRYAAPGLLALVTAFFAERRLWIADGHHRYETARAYQQEKAGRGADGPGPDNFILMGLTAFEDAGLVLLPTHRLVRDVAAERLTALAGNLERWFQLRSMPVQAAADAAIAPKRAGTSIILATAESAFEATLRERGELDSALGEGHSAAWRRLDVVALQSLVLDRSLGIPWSALDHTDAVAYTRDAGEAIMRVRAGEFQLACLLRPPDVRDVRDVASSGDKMPPKSTYFYPKLWSGIIVRSLRA